MKVNTNTETAEAEEIKCSCSVVVSTLPFHGKVAGSNPVGSTK